MARTFTSCWRVGAIATWDEVVKGAPGSIDLGPLKSNRGDQNYDLPFDLSYELHYKDPYVQQWNFITKGTVGSGRW